MDRNKPCPRHHGPFTGCLESGDIMTDARTPTLLPVLRTVVLYLHDTTVLLPVKAHLCPTTEYYILPVRVPNVDGSIRRLTGLTGHHGIYMSTISSFSVYRIFGRMQQMSNVSIQKI